jgi:hypothetical protein
MRAVKPFDFFYLSKTLNLSTVTYLTTAAIALGCFGGSVSNKFSKRDNDIGWLLVILGMGATVATRTSIRTAEDTKLILNDYEDISAQVRTNVEFKSLHEPTVTVPEYNWSSLVKTKGHVSITGDRDLSIKIAEYLSNSYKGTIVFVSNAIEDIKVTQQIVPGIGPANNLMDILSYAVSPSYSAIVESLDLHGELRANDSSIRQPLVVILDNPEVLPKPVRNINVSYIVTGKQVPGWVNIKVGSEAYLEAQNKTSTPYWQEVMSKWNTGMEPCLVNSQVAKIPNL